MFFTMANLIVQIVLFNGKNSIFDDHIMSYNIRKTAENRANIQCPYDYNGNKRAHFEWS